MLFPRSNNRRAMPFVGCAALLAVAAGASAQAPLSTAQIAARTASAVVTITTAQSQGSGVIVDASGIIATNLHVLRGQGKASIKLANGDVFDDVAVIDVDERKDLLLLRIKAVDLPTATVGNSERVAVGERVVVIGSPQGLERTVTDGVISAVRDSGDGYRIFQTSAAVSPGSSGGGLFNASGQLIGIVTAKLTSGENLNFVVPVNYLRGMLTAGAATPKPTTLNDLAVRFPAETSTPQPAATTASSQSTERDNAIRLLALLEASGVRYEKTGDTSWEIKFAGDNSDAVEVHVSVYDNFALIQSVVAKSPQLDLSRMIDIMKLNFATDLAKASLDNEGTLTVLNESELRLLDAEGLKTIANAVGAFADDLVGLLRGAALPAESVTALTAPPAAARDITLPLLQKRMTLRFNGMQWKSEPGDEPTMTDFEHSSGELWAKLIAERIQIPIAKLEDIALTNARSTDPNVKLLRRGNRMVNGTQMSFLEFQATTNGIPVRFIGHYFSDTFGTIQLLAWTGANLIDDHRRAIDQFVSGLQVAR